MANATLRKAVFFVTKIQDKNPCRKDGDLVYSQREGINRAPRALRKALRVTENARCADQNDRGQGVTVRLIRAEVT